MLYIYICLYDFLYFLSSLDIILIWHGASRWRVCNQLGLPPLVLKTLKTKLGKGYTILIGISMRKSVKFVFLIELLTWISNESLFPSHDMHLLGVFRDTHRSYDWVVYSDSQVAKIGYYLLWNCSPWQHGWVFFV